MCVSEGFAEAVMMEVLRPEVLARGFSDAMRRKVLLKLLRKEGVFDGIMSHKADGSGSHDPAWLICRLHAKYERDEQQRYEPLGTSRTLNLLIVTGSSTYPHFEAHRS